MESELPADSDVSNQPEQPPPNAGEIVARPGGYYRVTRLILALACIAMGAWFGYDGWVGWPEGNRKYDETRAELKKAQDAHDEARINQLSEEQKKYKIHGPWDLGLQKALCIGLP